MTENRARAANVLGTATENLISLYQIHSAKVVTVAEPWTRATAPQADAMVTRAEGIALGILTADCGPLLLWDEDAHIVAAAHAGWQGAFSGVIQETIEVMISMGAQRHRIAAVLGPTISQSAYEVGPEFVSRFVDKEPSGDRFFVASKRPDHAMFDLPKFIMDRLAQSGIERTSDLAECTYGNPQRYFSYRRTTHDGETDYGRNLSAIMLRPNP